MDTEQISPEKLTQSLKTEPRIKRETGYILCEVHVWKWPVVKYKHIKIKPRIYSKEFIKVFIVWPGR